MRERRTWEALVARCNCGGASCQCLVVAGTGTEVTGSGGVNDPYIISNTALAGAFMVTDTATVDLNVIGAGSPVDPYILSANAKIALLDLEDRGVTVAPEVGFVPVWRGSNWSFGAPPVAPAGATNTANGVGGTGSVADPVVARTSGVWGTGSLEGLGSNSLIGQAIYVDSAGNLRAAPLTNVPVLWDNVQNRPTFFPSTWDQVSGKPTTFPSTWNTVSGKPKVWLGEIPSGAVMNPGQSATRTLAWPAGYFDFTAGAPLIHVQLTISGQTPGAAASGFFTASIYTYTAAQLQVVVRNVSTSVFGTAGVSVMATQAVNDRF